MPLPRKMPQNIKTGKKKSKEKVEKRVLANRYHVERRLGSGNFGTAWIIRDAKAKEDKERLKALKEIPVGDLQPDETIEAVHEASLLRNLDHPSIVKFHDSFVDGDFFCIVTEYCEGGDLDQKIAEAKKKKRTIPEAQVMEWLIQLLLALQYMHDRRVLHRDLKARNIFLRNNVIKVGDFGISRILMGTSDMASTFVGTPYYMSPEVLKHEGYNSKSDVWSIGCILYELCALQHAFEGQSLMGVMYKIVEGNLPAWPEGYSTDLKEVFETLLLKDPHKRPSATDALKMHFIATQMEVLKNTMMDKHHQKGQRDQVRTESQQLWEEMKKDVRMDELRRESEDKRLKNMSPRERMRLKKQQQADEQARRLRVVTLQQQIDNKMKYDEIRRNNDPYGSHFDFEGNTQEVQINKGPAFTDYRALEESVRQPRVEEESDSDDDEQEDTIVDGRLGGTVVERPIQTKSTPTTPVTKTPFEIPSNLDQAGALGHKRSLSQTEKLTTSPYPQARTYGELSRTFNYGSPLPPPDERPITPMRDRMVYDVDHSSLDFDDGIPSNPELAETYYSQFEDFEKDEDEDADAGGQRDDGDDDDGESTLVAGAEDDVEDLILCMKNALDKSDTLKSQTLTEDKETSAYGILTRDVRIKNLRQLCIKGMTEDKFNQAYKVMKDSKDRKGKDVDAKLTAIGVNTETSQYLEQLSFLESWKEQ